MDLARVSLADKNITDAKIYAQQAFNLKNDYIDAMILLSQIFKEQGDVKNALMYAQLALSYYPTSSQLSQYADSLMLQGEIKNASENNNENKKQLD
jgi:tetratricopeptide (TPR) repeat protein